MKNLVESININEAAEWHYRVALLGFKDKSGTPITVTIAVPKELRKEFQKYLEEEKDNTVYAAEDVSGYWELD